MKYQGFDLNQSIRNTLSRVFPANNKAELADALETIVEMLRKADTLPKADNGEKLDIQNIEFTFNSGKDEELNTFRNLYFRATITNDPF